MEVHIPENRKYGKALDLLYRMGGIFRTKPTHILVIGPTQHEALVRAGLVEPIETKVRGRGGKKKKV